MSQPLLQVKNLSVTFDSEHGTVTAVDGLSFSLNRGETLGIVGESGCGKSVTCLAVMRLLPQPLGRISQGEILFEEKDLAQLSRDQLTSIRGRKIAMIFQEPMTALNPVETVGNQIKEVFELHFPDVSASDAEKETIKLLSQVGISAPEQRLNSYPHQLSGGMRQRVMIAMALACKPDILIADEPTTALDVTIQAQILELLRSIQISTGMSLIFITHDLGVVAEMCDKVLVMYGGRAVESGSVDDVFKNASHPYTLGLMRSLPRLDAKPKSLLQTIPGMVPPLHKMPIGCRFTSRCEHARDICNRPESIKTQLNNEHATWCVRHQEIARTM